MRRKVEYSKQTLSTPNPIARFAHKKRYSFSLALAKKFLRDGQSLLDYGCGTGDFLNKLKTFDKNLKLYGFDPESEHYSEQYQIVVNTKEIEDSSVNVICCFEVLEHLYHYESNKFYTEAKRILHSNGSIIISVPLIGGPILLLKEINRMFLFQRKTDYSFRELFLASFFNIKPARPKNLRTTHKGFDFYKTETEIRKNFTITNKYYSPFPRFPWYVNSQVFYIGSTEEYN